MIKGGYKSYEITGKVSMSITLTSVFLLITSFFYVYNGV